MRPFTSRTLILTFTGYVVIAAAVTVVAVAPAFATGPTSFSGSNSTAIVGVTQTGTGVGLGATAGSNSGLFGQTTFHSTSLAAAKSGIFGKDAESSAGFNAGVSGDAALVGLVGVFGSVSGASTFSGIPRSGVVGFVNSGGAPASSDFRLRATV